MKKRWRRIWIVLLSLLVSLSGCGDGGTTPLNPKSPVTITMWHNFGGEMQTTMDTLIDEFNGTVGKEKGVIINVSAITSSAELQKSLNMIAAGDPGAPEMPDITTAYPKTAILFQQKGMLAELGQYFPAQELEGYVPSFVEEGRMDEGLYVFPIAKSTEILYLNQTLFDQFAAENDVSMESLATFEGIADAAQKYYDWTDAKTPGIPGDGKAFFTADSWVNAAQAGMMQQGATLFTSDGVGGAVGNERLDLSSAAYARIWSVVCPPLLTGGFTIYDGYSSDLSKTGDLVCSTGSSAGILFYGDTITHPDGRVEPVEYSILPFPVFAGGEKLAIQRGNGMMVKKSDAAHEFASAVFLRWFTAPEQNMRFVASTGYLPVTKEAFENRMTTEIQRVEDYRIKKVLTAVHEMYREYEFFTAPAFENFDALSKGYEQDFKQFLNQERENWIASGQTNSPQAQAELALEAWRGQ